jgi:hypothetical protein
MKDNLKTILKYIQVYTECDNYALGKIALLFDEYPLENTLVKIVEKIVEKEVIKKFVPNKADIEEWTKKYLIENNITYEQLTANNRKYQTVLQRVNYSKAAREHGFYLSEIGRKLKMHHSSIIHLVNNFQQ